MMNVQMIKL